MTAQEAARHIWSTQEYGQHRGLAATSAAVGAAEYLFIPQYAAETDEGAAEYGAWLTAFAAEWITLQCQRSDTPAHITHTTLEHGAIVNIVSNSHTVSICSEEYGLCDCCDRPCTAEVTVKRMDGSYRRYGYCGECFVSLVLQGMGVAHQI